MISKYKQLDLDDAEVGMILSASVLDHQGSVLLPAGAALTDTLLTSMRRRGIDTVQVIDDTVSTQDLDAERHRIAERLERLFRRSDKSAADTALQVGVSTYRMESLQ